MPIRRSESLVILGADPTCAEGIVDSLKFVKIEKTALGFDEFASERCEIDLI